MMDSKQTGLSIPIGFIVMFQCRYDVKYDTAVICMDNEKPSSNRCEKYFETWSSFCWQNPYVKNVCYATAQHISAHHSIIL